MAHHLTDSESLLIINHYFLRRSSCETTCIHRCMYYCDYDYGHINHPSNTSGNDCGACFCNPKRHNNQNTLYMVRQSFIPLQQPYRLIIQAEFLMAHHVIKLAIKQNLSCNKQNARQIIITDSIDCINRQSLNMYSCRLHRFDRSSFCSISSRDA